MILIFERLLHWQLGVSIYQVRIETDSKLVDPFKIDAPRFLAFPCGLIRGALLSLQVNAHVTVDVAALPNAKFKIDVYRK